MLAASNGSVGIVKKLIQHGASVNLTNKVTVESPQESILDIATLMPCTLNSLYQYFAYTSCLPTPVPYQDFNFCE